MSFSDGEVEAILSSGVIAKFGLRGGSISGDAALAASLPIASVVGEDLAIASASSKLLANCDKILEIYESWGWGSRVQVHCASVHSRGPARGVGAFFSGGVDSTFTVLRRPEVTHLIYVVGFDVALENARLRRAVMRAIRQAGNALNKEVLVLETNIRSFADPYMSWQRYHGAALAFAAHSLKDVCGKVLVPSTHHYEDDFPWGSHPRLDHLWSSEDLRIVHDSADFARTEKTMFIAKHPAALEWLRVCWKNPDDAYNCGRCEKCLRTMLTLEAIRAPAPTFPTLRPELLAKQRFRDPNSLAFAMENLELLETAGRPDLLKALSRAITRSRRPSLRSAAKRVRDVFRR